jgi:FMN reductase (NADPH)/FMN reductase [NAD(P)H]
VPDAVRDEILRAALRAPTAGNMMLYTILHVSDPAAKATLARTCDNQPFIATAPLVLLFLADYQRWYDDFLLSGAGELNARRANRCRRPRKAISSWPAATH